MGRSGMTVLERFEEKYIPEPNSGCWLWTGCTHKTSGYGGIMIERKKRQAHRVSWVLYRGEIPDGLEIDHLCRTRNCVNPAHLEPVTPKENRLRGMGWAGIHARKTHCPKGHTLVLDVQHGGKRRFCATCFGGKGGIPNGEKTHCPQGHEYTPSNTGSKNGIGRTCRECNRIRARSERAHAYDRVRRATPEFKSRRRSPEGRAKAREHTRAYRERRALRLMQEVSLGVA